jgi:3-hydroxyacyl-CoA dehydrogenase/enoyl-CoA hydratase/3-hydroxybutyryl-CoA epimerase
MKLKTIQYGIQDGIAVITFDEENSPVNTMCLQWQDDLDAVAAQVAKDKDAIRGIILASAKSTFFAGADLKGVMRMQPEDASASSSRSSASRRTSASWRPWASRWSAA